MQQFLGSRQPRQVDIDGVWPHTFVLLNLSTHIDSLRNELEEGFRIDSLPANKFELEVVELLECEAFDHGEDFLVVGEEVFLFVGWIDAI